MKCLSCPELKRNGEYYYCPPQDAEIFNPKNTWCDYQEQKVIQFHSQQTKPIVVLPSVFDRSRLSDGVDKTVDTYNRRKKDGTTLGKHLKTRSKAGEDKDKDMPVDMDTYADTQSQQKICSYSPLNASLISADIKLK